LIYFPLFFTAESAENAELDFFLNTKNEMENKKSDIFYFLFFILPISLRSLRALR